MTTARACRLTWHRGSVLPYSSLWHTVQRAKWLNSLRPSELSFCTCALDQGGFPRQVNLLFNETSGGRRSARIAPEAALADYLIHADLAFEASPLPSYFQYARTAGERSARRHLPLLLDRLQQAGLAAQTHAIRPKP